MIGEEKYIDAACSGTDFNILFATLMPSNESLTERNRMLFKDCLKAKKGVWRSSSYGL